MKINKIIKEKRIILGLTQEQLANLLGVSTPAVNKWEKGVSYPDITLLPPLARILKVDLNTLLSFKEDLTDEDIVFFMNEVCTEINEKGFEVGFNIAMDKVNEYPSCDKLCLNIALVLQGSIIMNFIKEKNKYEDSINMLFERAFNSDDLEVRNAATPMIINRYLQSNEFEKAQGCVDKLPNNDVDKKMLQARIYNDKEEFSEAEKIYNEKLLTTTSDLYSIVLHMMDIAIKEKRFEDAEYYAKVLEDTATLYDMWSYNKYVGYFQLYTAQKNEIKTIESLKRMLSEMKGKWDISSSPLYRYIKKKDGEGEMYNTFINTLLRSLESESEFNFLKDNKEFKCLLNSLNTD